MRKIKYFLALTFISLGLVCFINCTDETKETQNYEPITLHTDYPPEKILSKTELSDLFILDLRYTENSMLQAFSLYRDGLALFEYPSEGDYKQIWQEQTYYTSIFYSIFSDNSIQWLCRDYERLFEAGYDKSSTISSTYVQGLNFYSKINPINQNIVMIEGVDFKMKMKIVSGIDYSVTKDWTAFAEQKTPDSSIEYKTAFNDNGDFLVLYINERLLAQSSSNFKNAYCILFDKNGNPLTELKLLSTDTSEWYSYDICKINNDFLIISSGNLGRTLNAYHFNTETKEISVIEKIFESKTEYSYLFNHIRVDSFPNGNFLVSSHYSNSRKSQYFIRILRFNSDYNMVGNPFDIVFNDYSPSYHIATKEDGEFAVWWKDNYGIGKSYISRYLF